MEDILEQVSQAQLQAPGVGESGPYGSYSQAQLTNPATKDSLTEKEQASVREITKMLNVAVTKELSSQAFIELMKTTGLKPVATANKNPDTGQMTMIRASNALEGTRYFHAQYFGAENRDDFPQHLSFEIRPSNNSLEIATKMVEESFKGNLRLVETRAGYRRWETGNSREIWAKELDREEVMESPINPRDEDDIGTVMVAVEHKIHEDHDDH